MDSSEATKVVYSRIQSLDPENASKIMGYIFIQDPGDKEMIRLAFGPETLLLSLINQAKTHLGISSNTSSTPQSSPRVIIPNNGFHLSPSSPSSPWSVSGFSDHRSPSAGRPASYAAVVNGGASGSFSPPSGSSFLPPPPFLSNSNFSDDYNLQVPDQLSFIEDSSSKNGDFNFIDPIMSPSGRSDSILFPYSNNSAGNCVDSGNCSQNYQQHNLHRRSFSVNDVYLGAAGSEDGFGWRPCMYFARGFCKNGSSCKFLHGGFGDLSDSSATIVGSPGKLDGFDELLRMKAIQQQRLATASQLMTGGSFPYSKGMNFMSDSPRSTGAALMMSEEFHKFGRCRPERSDFSAMGFGAVDSSSRQIYLTFPADSTFKEEDVSNYFSKFGPVQDVRIPYQQKRMFGFVTFVFPETVKMILAKGNPHFVCDSRVLVKPYKEKGKVPEKRQQPHQFERGEFSACPNPTGLDSRESYDFPVGTRMLFNNQEMLRRKLEQAELQQALELQGRRLMNLQLMDLKNHHHNHHAHQFQPPGMAISSPVQPQLQTNHSFFLRSDNSNHIVSEENSVSAVADSATAYEQQDDLQEVKEACDNCNANANGNIKEQLVDLKNDDLHESLEHILPDNLFASPTKSAGDHGSIFSSARSEADYSSSVAAATSSTIISVLPAQSSLNMPSLKSCYLQMPRFSSGQEAVEM